MQSTPPASIVAQIVNEKKTQRPSGQRRRPTLTAAAVRPPCMHTGEPKPMTWPTFDRKVDMVASER
eukprot:709845-Prymnesium_polylepis.1